MPETILGLQPPWTVERVALREAAAEIDVWVAHVATAVDQVRQQEHTALVAAGEAPLRNHNK